MPYTSLIEVSNLIVAFHIHDSKKYVCQIAFIYDQCLLYISNKVSSERVVQQ